MNQHRFFKMSTGKRNEKCYIQSDNICPYKNTTFYISYMYVAKYKNVEWVI